MKDYKLKQRNLRASHTLGWSWNFGKPPRERKKKKEKKRKKTVGWENGEAKKRIANLSKFTESYNPLTSPLQCKKFKSQQG